MSDQLQCTPVHDRGESALQALPASRAAAVPFPANDPDCGAGHIAVPPVPGGAGGRPPGSVPPPEWIAAEVRATAHLVRGLAERLLGLVELLPLPPEEVLDALGADQAFSRYPAYELYADVQVTVSEHLQTAADLLLEAGERPLSPRQGWSGRNEDPEEDDDE